MTVSVSKRPGNMMIHSAVRRYARPSAIMLPQLGMLGGGTPLPEN